jgi:hypothetical protein
MLGFLQLLGTFVANLFRSQRRLEVENLFLRHQLNIALRSAPHRLRLRGSDRALLVWMTWLWPSLLGLARVVQPDTILRWHRAGFRAYWRWKSSPFRTPSTWPRLYQFSLTLGNVAPICADLTWRTETGLPGWACRTRTQKCRRKLSL